MDATQGLINIARPDSLDRAQLTNSPSDPTAKQPTNTRPAGSGTMPAAAQARGQLSSFQADTTRVEFEHDAKANRIWLNIVDGSTGKVILKIPPEVVRDIVDGQFAEPGLAVDERR